MTTATKPPKDIFKLRKKVLPGETIQGTWVGAGWYSCILALVATAVLGFFVVTIVLIPFAWIFALMSISNTRAILTDKALYSMGGRISYEEIQGIEYDGNSSLKVRGHGSVYRLTGIKDAGTLNQTLKDGRE